jgi:hypothetical protein
MPCISGKLGIIISISDAAKIIGSIKENKSIFKL